MHELTIHGLAMPYGQEFIRPLPHGDALRVRMAPGAFAATLQRTGTPVSLNVDHAYGATPIDQLACRDDGSLVVWEEPSGLFFEANLRRHPAIGARVVDLVRGGHIKHVCIKTRGFSPFLLFPSNRRGVEFLQVPALESIALLVLADPVAPSTWVRVGAAPNRPTGHAPTVTAAPTSIATSARFGAPLELIWRDRDGELWNEPDHADA